MNTSDKPGASMSKNPSHSPTALEQDYLPLPRIICRIAPMHAKPYATRSWVAVNGTRLKQRIAKLFSGRF